MPSEISLSHVFQLLVALGSAVLVALLAAVKVLSGQKEALYKLLLEAQEARLAERDALLAASYAQQRENVKTDTELAANLARMASAVEKLNNTIGKP